MAFKKKEVKKEEEVKVEKTDNVIFDPNKVLAKEE